MELAARFSTQSVMHVTPFAAQIHGHKRDIDRRATITNTYVHRRYHVNTHDPAPLHSSVIQARILQCHQTLPLLEGAATLD